MQRLVRTNGDIREALVATCNDPVQAEAQYGPIEEWLVGEVTDMHELFEGMDEFNKDISRWNVGNVTNMRRMFFEASSFNQPLGGWNVDNVTNMGGMFLGASRFNQPLCGIYI